MSSHSNHACAAPGVCSAAISGKYRLSAAFQCNLSVPVSATYQCQSVPPISAASQCRLSVPVSAAYQWASVPPISAYQCQSVPPNSASQCRL
ncbi:unnamed protein product [Staurois parvus]|uniref:Uncharacterized protein n=1 Tax=Staurois parvus TaxID=386267 RepID=A0ABN9CDB3_9NEOB|nr:unnamed protein product [Staurois parvus]